MRLRELQQVLSGALPGLAGEMSGQTLPNGKAGGMVRQRFAIMGSLRALAVLPSDIGETASRLLGASFVVAGDSDIVGPQEDVRAWATELARLRTRVGDVLEGIDLAIPKQSDLTISVCVPKPETPGDLASTCEELQFIFNDALSRLTGEQVRVQNLDSGSDWIELVAHTAQGLQLIAEFLGISHAHTIHRREDDRCVARLRAVRVAEAQLTSTQLSLDAARRELFEPQIKALAESSPGGKKSKAIKEDISFTLNAMERLSALTERGARVVLALTAPPEAAKAAPSRAAVEQLAADAVARVEELGAPPAGDDAK